MTPFSAEGARIAPPFRGQRNYIYAADIADAVLALVPGASAMRLTLRKTPDRPIRFFESGESASVPNDTLEFCGTCDATMDGRARHYRLYRDLGDAITGRVPDESDRLLAACMANADGFIMPPGREGSFVARLMAGVLATMRLRAPGRSWRVPDLSFARLPLAAEAGISFRVFGGVGGRFWKGAFAADGEPAGEMILAGLTQTE